MVAGIAKMLDALANGCGDILVNTMSTFICADVADRLVAIMKIIGG